MKIKTIALYMKKQQTVKSAVNWFIKFCASSIHLEKGKHHFYIYKFAISKIAVFGDNIFFVVL